MLWIGGRGLPLLLRPGRTGQQQGSSVWAKDAARWPLHSGCYAMYLHYDGSTVTCLCVVWQVSQGLSQLMCWGVHLCVLWNTSKLAPSQWFEATDHSFV